MPNEPVTVSFTAEHGTSGVPRQSKTVTVYETPVTPPAPDWLPIAIGAGALILFGLAVIGYLAKR
jgi:hypothetical protein